MAEDESDQVLLAMPRGGFNDMLCQLELCVRAAERSGRLLVVDTRQSGLEDDLFEYFDLAPGQRIVALRDWSGTVATAHGRITATHGDTETVWQLPEGDLDLRYDEGQPQDAPILLHYAHGGGELGVAFLARLRLKPALVDRILGARRAIGGRYAAVHIRHTDYQTDFRTAFRLIARRMRGWRLLICSDSQIPIGYFAKTHGPEFDWTTTDTARSSDNSPLHYSGGTRVSERNAEMLTDLYLMATAARLVMVDTLNSKRSGFAVLAAHMRRRLDVASLDQGAEGVPALTLKARFPLWLGSLWSNPFRVWRLRKLGDRPSGPTILHPTPE
ncbi:hypothetical protein [Frigidibacter sp. ROC022]|uniref:hypothetical protein n=1 Tax=Frigidibacter sp. ROC022 TaxID=2971796 RepID=UPI00215A9595|nr:hypothetical protein [Frigidibacter sp. ROC022]MCR8725932.1 hypothetical protein [Frigidibacter sp. ROC022]